MQQKVCLLGIEITLGSNIVRLDGQNKPPLELFAKMFDIIGEIKRQKENPINLLSGAFPKTSVKY